MHYEFKKNGEISLTIRPDADAIEQAFFKSLFENEVEFVKKSSVNHPDEIVIKRKSIAPVMIPLPGYEVLAT